MKSIQSAAFFAVGLAVLTGGAATISAFAADSDLAVMSVDASKPMGDLKPFFGVSGAPDMTFIKEEPAAEGRPPGRARDISAAYRAARVNLVRTHDSQGAADIDPETGPLPPLPARPGGGGARREVSKEMMIFPNLAADPADPKSYNFGPTDKLISGIRAINADVIFRLGRGGSTTAEAPKDMARYGEIIRHIVMHYNKGWSNGFQNTVRYWEVWNEPDLGITWWRGTPDEYYRLYASAAKAVKAADPQAQVGGPTAALVNQKQPYREGFLAYVRDNKLPLDFFSWHYYSQGKDPQDFPKIAVEMRRLLDEYGFQKTTSSLDEWNSTLAEIRVTDLNQGAFIASSLIYMQDAPIDQEAFYRADSMFGGDGKATTKAGQALMAVGRMRDTPVRLTAAGADLNGLAMQAGRSRDGKTVQVLISNYQIPDSENGPRPGPDVLSIRGMFDLVLLPRRTVTYSHNRGYDLAINGLAANGKYTVERYRVSADHDLTLVDSTTSTGAAVHLSAALPPPGIELIVVRQQ